MISGSQNRHFTIRTNESNSLYEIVKWTFCFIRIWIENMVTEFEKLVRAETGECRINTIFGYFKFC